jgi:hypothetical protein
MLIRLPPRFQKCDCLRDLPFSDAERQSPSMLDSTQTKLTDRMIASLEDANTRSYQHLKGTDQSSSPSEQDEGHHPSDQQPARKRRLSRASLWLFALVGLVLPAAVYVKAFVWEPSYSEATQLTIAQWINASTPPQPARQDKVMSEPLTASEVDRRLQMITDELADERRQIEQLKVGQDEISRHSAMLTEQFKAGLEQMARDNAKVADQLNSGLAQMTKRDAAITVQIKDTQDRLAEATSSRPINPARKPSRRGHVPPPRARR